MHVMLVLDALLKFLVLVMFILNNSSTGCWCIDPAASLQPVHGARGMINGSRATTT